MKDIVYIEGVKAIVQQFKFRFLAIALLAVCSIGFTACGPKADGDQTSSDAAAATVNGKAIKMEAVERLVKQQAQGQDAKMSPLELAQARLQVLQNLIQQEVMFQKAEKEKTIPTDDEVTAEYNKMKTQSGQSAEELEKKMKEAGETEESIREGIKQQLSINKLIEKVTSKVDAPKDSEIEAFYKGNPEAFIKRKGVKLSAIVVDPRNNGEGDKTVDEASAALAIKEIGAQLNQGTPFESVAKEKSEDQSAAQNGDLGYISEDQLKQSYPQLVGFMNPQFPVGKLAGPFNIEGKFFIFKLVERNDKDENQTLETPGVRQQITDALTNGRKNLVSQAYAAQAMNEAKIDNLLLKQIIDNPNNLSGARPVAAADANSNSNSAAATANSNANALANKSAANEAKPANEPKSEVKKEANTAAKPAANTK